MASSFSIGKHFETVIEGLIDSGRYSTAAKSSAKDYGWSKSAKSAAKPNSKRCAPRFRKVLTAGLLKKSISLSFSNL